MTATAGETLRGRAALVTGANCIAPGALDTRMLDEVLEAGPDRVGQAFYDRSLQQKAGSSGRLISAQWDPWAALPEHRAELAQSDIYTLRRITARERGKAWEPI